MKNPDTVKFTVGMAVTYMAIPRWYVRLWRWVTQWKPGTLTVVAVDHEAGTVTVR